jgi:hypothetical protein
MNRTVKLKNNCLGASTIQKAPTLHDCYIELQEKKYPIWCDVNHYGRNQQSYCFGTYTNLNWEREKRTHYTTLLIPTKGIESHYNTFIS